ncbi:MAG: hypothetical protein QOI67_331, partial [Gaiellaceae bacterium]|nr:hypothetical protein [Gaiellaceae bacterium]
MAYEFKLPDLGEGLTEGEIARWLVAEGQEIAEDDPLVEIQTDKTTVEIPSPAAGVVSKIYAAEGDVVPVGTVIVAIADGSAAVALEGAPEQPRAEAVVAGPAASRDLVPGHGGDGRVRATPLVRRLAGELGLELESVEGTGPQGRVTEADVRAAATTTDQVPRHGLEGRRERLRGVRRVIAEHMTRAQSIPAVTWVEECDFGNVDLKQLV